MKVNRDVDLDSTSFRLQVICSVKRGRLSLVPKHPDGAPSRSHPNPFL